MTTKIIIRKPGLNGFKYSLFNEAGVWFANALSMAEIRSYYAYELRHGMIELVKDFEKPVDAAEVTASHMAIVKMTEEIIKALVSDPEEQIAALPFHDQEEETYTEEIHDDEENDLDIKIKYEDGSYEDRHGNLFDKDGHILAEVGTDAYFDRYSIQVQNGEGYYDNNGKYHNYHYGDDY